MYLINLTFLLMKEDIVIKKIFVLTIHDIIRGI